MTDLSKLLENLASTLGATDDDDDADENSEDMRNTPDALQQAYVRFSQSYPSFAPGTIVRWKPGMKNKKRPKLDEPVIVVETLATPIFDTENDPGSPYFYEPLDVVVGMLDDDNDLVCWHLDSRRLEPWYLEGQCQTMTEGNADD